MRPYLRNTSITQHRVRPHADADADADADTAVHSYRLNSIRPRSATGLAIPRAETRTVNGGNARCATASQRPPLPQTSAASG
jgi:hypothetical protein